MIYKQKDITRCYNSKIVKVKKGNKEEYLLHYRSLTNGHKVIGYIKLSDFYRKAAPVSTAFELEKNIYSSVYKKRPKNNTVIGYLEVENKKDIAICENDRNIIRIYIKIIAIILFMFVFLKTLNL